jgi:predicted Fe-S protein YdhL (DUF1289 family)
MAIRTPTLDDYRQHTGLHYHKLWKELDDYWTCPGCGRTKFEIMRWTKRFPNTPGAVMGWVAALHTHHDHSASPRFREVVICDQCNSSDGAVKRKLGLPKNFSFSPQEIRMFVKATPHAKHEIDYNKAADVFTQLKSIPRFW